MRADARVNRDQILVAAHQVVTEEGADASLRDIARRAEVGLATLFRHFPTREDLMEALLRARLETLTGKAAELEASASPDEALAAWLRDAIAFLRIYNGVVAMMATALADSTSALHASCDCLRSAGARLLRGAQAHGTARSDLDGDDLFALLGALGWIGDQSAFAPRAGRLSEIIFEAVIAKR
ncbi:TetR/AcrR family transcriptional regulator [Methylobacterium sp. WL122]|nr:TetR/AcrR family transcriptional regulator [Methylobacterium sp. WL122]